MKITDRYNAERSTIHVDGDWLNTASVSTLGELIHHINGGGSFEYGTARGQPVIGFDPADRHAPRYFIELLPAWLVICVVTPADMPLFTMRAMEQAIESAVRVTKTIHPREQLKGMTKELKAVGATLDQIRSLPTPREKSRAAANKRETELQADRMARLAAGAKAAAKAAHRKRK